MSIQKKVDVPDNIRTIILNMIWSNDGTLGKLTQQLDRPVYVATNKILEMLGGKWNRKLGGHVFEHDPRPALQPLETGDGLTLDVWGYFQTPPAIVDKMIQATIPENGTRILEPSAGGGAILVGLQNYFHTAFLPNVTAVELHPGRAKDLARFGCRIMQQDFLTFQGNKFDVVLMNPPFEKCQDRNHILHAWEMLKPGGCMAAIAAGGFTFRDDYKELKLLVEENGWWDELPPGAFENTNVRAVLMYLEKQAEAGGKIFKQGVLF